MSRAHYSTLLYSFPTLDTLDATLTGVETEWLIAW
jgi:hypothetical protein